MLIVRTEINPSIGGGHFSRCLSLALEWQKEDDDIVFVMRSEQREALARLEKERIRLQSLRRESDIEGELEVVFQGLCPSRDVWFVLDGYEFGEDYQNGIKQRGFQLLSIDDCATLKHYPADIVLNPNAGAKSLLYSVPEKSLLLVGQEYLLLPPGMRGFADRERFMRPQVRNILVSMGAMPSSGDVQRLCGLLLDCGLEDIHIRFVGIQNVNQIELLKENFEFVEFGSNIEKHMSWADIALTAAGTTAWELAYLGIPSILFTLADNQRGIAKFFRENRLGLVLDDFKKLSVKRLKSQLEELIGNAELRAELSERGRILMDGLGTWRVVKAMRSYGSVTVI